MTDTFTVLALARHIGGFYAGEVISGLTREVRAAGGTVLVVQAVEPQDGIDRLSPAEFALPVGVDTVDAVVSIAPAATGPLLEVLRAAGKPVVLASERMEGFSAPVAVPDNRSGVRAGVEHLIAHGHTRIGFVADMSQHDFRQRRAVYAEVMAEHGLPAGEDLFYPAANYGDLGGVTAARALLSRPDRPTAVMTATDENAFGLIRELAAAGVSVPRDLAVVGFDNVEHAVFSTPSLSSVHQRFDEVGALAARLAIAMLRGEDVPHETHVASASVLIPRGSCGCREDILVQRPLVAPAPAGLATERPELHAMLHTLLDRRDRGLLTEDAVQRVIDAVETLITAEDDLAPDAVPTFVEFIRHLVPGERGRRQLVGALTEYLQRLASIDHELGGSGRRVGVARLTAGLWELQAYGAVQQGREREVSVLEHGNVASALLRTDPDTVRRLDWMRETHLRVGMLALWDGPPALGRLTVVGQHDPEGVLADHRGLSTDVRTFPPADMAAGVDVDRGEVCLVVPVRTAERDWGLLAVHAVIDTSWNREPYHHWANVLCLAFEADVLQQAARANEERYAYAAKASNDGLWELDLSTGQLYLSARCQDLVGITMPQPPVGAWLERIHPEDQDLVTATFTAATTQPETPVEVEYRVRAADETYRWVLSRGLAVAAPDGEVVRMVGSLADVDTRHQLEDRLRQGALYDEVTGLPNRRLFLERLETAIQHTGRGGQAGFAVIFLDLDGFKLVNDSLGHLLGDVLLKTVADRLRDDLRRTDTAARFGGDEFAILLCDPLPEEVLAIAQRIQQSIAAPIVLDGHEVSVTASVGIASSQSGYADAEEVLRDSDIAMYHAKETERGSASLFDRVMHTRAAGRLRARAELRTALTEHQFVVHYQPIVALDGSPVQQFEALVRWEHPERGLLPPGEFLPAMEDNTSIVSLGQWVLDEVCRQISTWYRTTGHVAAVAVNLSHREFWSPDLRGTVAAALRRHAVPDGALVLEITESVIMADPDAARLAMSSLRELGVSLHIDDFGTGHSSLAALRTFPVDALKIDGSFIRELDVVTQTTELVRIIIAMGAALGMEVVAECVETSEQADSLLDMGCANAQGWLYARAVPGGAAGELLGTRLGVLSAAGSLT